MAGRKIFLYLTLTLIMGGIISCDRIDIFSQAVNNVTASATPPSASFLGSQDINSEIIIEFNHSMDTTSLSQGGDIGDAEFTWSTRTRKNDTVTLKPEGAWNTGAALTLTVSCKSSSGHTVTLDSTYDVFPSLRFVSAAAGTGATPVGSRNAPFTDIQDAINSISAPLPGMILVAGGTYSKADTSFNLNGNINIIGGWAADWSSRDPENTPSILIDSRTAPSGLNSVIQIHAGVPNTAEIAGFTIQVTPIAGTTTYGICIEGASPVIRDFKITSPDSPDSNNLHTVGIYLSANSSAVIHDGTISLGGFTRDAAGSNNCINEGIFFEDSSPRIYNLAISIKDSIDSTNLTSRGISALNSNNIPPGSISNSSISLGAYNQVTAAASDSTIDGIYLNNSSTEITSVNITSRNASGGTNIITRGINITGAGNAKISAGTIQLGNVSDGGGSSDCHNYGMTITGGTPEIFNMSIHAGVITALLGQTFGIYVSSASPVIRENILINGGKSTHRAYGIKITNINSASIVDNDQISVDGCDVQSFGIHVDTVAAGCDPVLRNNTITGVAGNSACGILVRSGANPTIDQNKIRLISGDVNSYGIEIYSDAAISITRNIIRVDAATNIAHGLLIDGVAANAVTVTNNVISAGGTGASDSRGIQLTASSANIRNNTISGGKGNIACAIWMDTNDFPTDEVNIENNLLFAEKDPVSGSYGIWEETSTSDPVMLAYNNFFNCEFACRDENTTDVGLAFINNDTMITGTFTLAGNDNEPIFDKLDPDNDFQLLPLSAAELLALNFVTSGDDGSAWPLTIDILGNARTASASSPPGWSMGAHEYDF